MDNVLGVLRIAGDGMELVADDGMCLVWVTVSYAMSDIDVARVQLLSSSRLLP